MALPGAEAPYVHGQWQLLEAVREATTQNATPVQPLQLTPDMALTEALSAPRAGRP